MTPTERKALELAYRHRSDAVAAWVSGEYAVSRCWGTHGVRYSHIDNTIVVRVGSRLVPVSVPLLDHLRGQEYQK